MVHIWTLFQKIMERTVHIWAVFQKILDRTVHIISFLQVVYSPDEQGGGSGGLRPPVETKVKKYSQTKLSMDQGQLACTELQVFVCWLQPSASPMHFKYLACRFPQTWVISDSSKWGIPERDICSWAWYSQGSAKYTEFLGNRRRRRRRHLVQIWAKVQFLQHWHVPKFQNTTFFRNKSPCGSLPPEVFSELTSREFIHFYNNLKNGESPIFGILVTFYQVTEIFSENQNGPYGP